MKTNYRKTPPYMTKTGVQIGLLHQEPFESRMDEDAYRLQRALLNKRYLKQDDGTLLIDKVIFILCVALLVGMVIGAVDHVL